MKPSPEERILRRIRWVESGRCDPESNPFLRSSRYERLRPFVNTIGGLDGHLLRWWRDRTAGDVNEMIRCNLLGWWPMIHWDSATLVHLARLIQAGGQHWPETCELAKHALTVGHEHVAASDMSDLDKSLIADALKRCERTKAEPTAILEVNTSISSPRSRDRDTHRCLLVGGLHVARRPLRQTACSA